MLYIGPLPCHHFLRNIYLNAADWALPCQHFLTNIYLNAVYWSPVTSPLPNTYLSKCCILGPCPDTVSLYTSIAECIQVFTPMLTNHQSEYICYNIIHYGIFHRKIQTYCLGKEIEGKEKIRSKNSEFVIKL